MFYHLITHTACNLSCTYCDRDEFAPVDEDVYDYSVPPRISYDMVALQSFITPEDYVTFYGGEPLLAVDDVKRIMDTVRCKGFMIQTNGLLLHRLGPDYVCRFHTILVSIDGDATATDSSRGSGVHRKVMDNVALVRQQGFQGELIARMTITKNSSLYDQVLWLVEHGFDNIHWQVDGMFYDDSPYDWYDEYNRDVTRLFDWWVEQMQKGRVVRLYPFLVLMDSLLRNEKARLRCGAGFSNFTITTHGKIAPCPIMGSMKKYYCGDIQTKQIHCMELGEPCKSCDIVYLCGGRCLYVNLTRHGVDVPYRALCGTVRHLCSELSIRKPLVEGLLQAGVIRIEDFAHLKYNGVEVIP